MKIGDLVRESPDKAFAHDRDALGIILEVREGIATVLWFWHKIFGQHERYETSDELIFFQKNT